MIKRILFILLCLGFFVSCDFTGNKDQADNHNIKIDRYDHLQFEYVTTNSFTALQKMNMEYPQATKLLIEDVLAIGEVDDSKINDRMVDYFRDTTLLTLMYEAEEKFKDITSIENQFTRGFKKLKKEIPGIKIPRIYSQLSALNQSVVVGDSIIGFSIDKYMGSDYPLYKRYYHEYQSRLMTQERIAPDCFTFYLLSQYPLNWNPKRNLLDIMMHRGKINWVVSNILGYKSFEKELGYSENDIEWCKNNKDILWDNMILKGHIYTNDPMIVRSYIKEDPFRLILSIETPPSIGVWMGMQLIDKYMKINKEKTINELLNDTDYVGMISSMNLKI